MEIEQNLYRMIVENLKSAICLEERPWLSGCNLKYCQECRHCGFDRYKIRLVENEKGKTGLYLDYDGLNGEPITANS